MYFNQIDEKRRTAIYVRISTAMQKTDRQVEELVSFAKSNRLNFDESTDIYKDIISGFKDGEDRPNFSILMAKLEMGEYTQVLFSEFSRLERKPLQHCHSSDGAQLQVCRKNGSLQGEMQRRSERSDVQA